MVLNIILIWAFFKYFTGIIFFEMLTVIPVEKWQSSIIELRKGKFLPQSSLRNMETRLIEHILSNNPDDRPSIPDIIQVASFLEGNEEGYQKYKDMFK